MSSLIRNGLIAACLLGSLGVSWDADARSKDHFTIEMQDIAAQGDVDIAIAELSAISEANKGKGLVNKYAEFKMVKHHITGLPIFMQGHFPTSERGFRPERVAEHFLNAHRVAFGLDGAGVTLLRKSVTADSAGLDHTRFSLFVQGVPVEGAEIIVHSEGGIVRSVDSSLVPTRGLNLKVEISPSDAATLAEENLQQRINEMSHLDGGETFRYRRVKAKGEPILTWLNLGIITGEGNHTTPAWKVDVNGWQYFVSAHNGEVLFGYDNMQAALYRLTFSANNETILPGTLVLSEETENPADTTLDINILDAHLYASDVYNYYMDVHGRDSWNGQGADMMSTVHYGENYVNAFWNSQQMVYGDGDNMVQDDICGHEVTHGVIQSSASLIYAHQPGAVNEAIADVMAYFMTQDPTIGEGLRQGAIRDISDPAAYGQPDHMDGYRFLPMAIDNGGVHIFSGIVSHAAYLMTEGGEKSGIVVEGQGFEVAEAIWYQALTQHMLPISNFKHARLSVESACGELYGAESSPCVAVSAAFEAQGIS